MDDSHDTTRIPEGDRSCRFLFEDADIRGESVLLDTALRDILDIHQYAPGVSQQLGELLAAAVLLRGTLKFEGKLVLQARTEGQIPLLMAECSQQWQHACTLAATVRPPELLGIGTEDLLTRLYHEDALRLFEPAPVKFRCSCSRERTLRALSAIDRSELQSLLQEMGCITMDCEFCNQQYRYLAEDLLDLLGTGSSPILH